MSSAVPDPDSEVPKALRDEFFAFMKSKQSERVPADEVLVVGKERWVRSYLIWPSKNTFALPLKPPRWIAPYTWVSTAYPTSR